MSGIALNLINRKFGRLVVINRAPNRLSSKGIQQVYWNCICKCGTEKEIKSISLLNKKEGTRSCGCLQKEHAKKQGGFNYKGKNVAGNNFLFRKYKQSANTRNLEFSLTKEEFETMLDGNCFYCGDAPKNIWKRTETASTRIYNGIDRMDSKKGYVKDNCVTCCYICNTGKMDNSYDDFMNMVKKIYERNFK